MSCPTDEYLLRVDDNEQLTESERLKTVYCVEKLPVDTAT